MPLFETIQLFLLWVSIPAIIFVVIRMLRLSLGRARNKKNEAKCPCSYPLEGPDLARFRERGRVVGFDATAEALGLTQEQLECAQRKCSRAGGGYFIICIPGCMIIPPSFIPGPFDGFTSNF